MKNSPKHEWKAYSSSCFLFLSSSTFFFFYKGMLDIQINFDTRFHLITYKAKEVDQLRNYKIIIN